MALKLGIFPVCGVLLILFDSSSLLLLRRRLRGGSDVSKTHACAFMFEVAPQNWACVTPRRGQLAVARCASTFGVRARARQGKSTSAASGRRDSGSAPADAGRRRKPAGSEAALKASLRLEATRRRTRTRARPRNHCASVPSLSAAQRPRAPPWTKAPRARRLRVRTARSASPPW